MKDILRHDKIKVSGVALSLLGIAVGYWLVNFLYGAPMIDLVTPTLLGLPIIDWLVSVVLVGFALMSFAQKMSEQRTVRAFALGFPMAALSMLTLYLWWDMETGRGTSYAAAIAFFILVTAGNVVLALAFAARDGF